MASTSSSRKNSQSAPDGHSTAKRTPTDSSYYDFGGVPYDDGNPNSATWMYARDARAQMAQVPPNHIAGKYPSGFWNREAKPLSTPGSKVPMRRGEQHGWLHFPLVPGTSDKYAGGQGNTAGGVRSVYTKEDPTKFDVVYHNRTKGTTGQGSGTFDTATYVPRVKK